MLELYNKAIIIFITYIVKRGDHFLVLIVLFKLI